MGLLKATIPRRSAVIPSPEGVTYGGKAIAPATRFARLYADGRHSSEHMAGKRMEEPADFSAPYTLSIGQQGYELAVSNGFLALQGTGASEASIRPDIGPQGNNRTHWTLQAGDYRMSPLAQMGYQVSDAGALVVAGAAMHQGTLLLLPELAPLLAYHEALDVAAEYDLYASVITDAQARVQARPTPRWRRLAALFQPSYSVEDAHILSTLLFGVYRHRAEYNERQARCAHGHPRNELDQYNGDFEYDATSGAVMAMAITQIRDTYDEDALNALQEPRAQFCFADTLRIESYVPRRPGKPQSSPPPLPPALARLHGLRLDQVDSILAQFAGTLLE